MPRYFSDEQIAELAVSYEDMSRKFRELQERICAEKKFETSRGAEFAKHGLLRRLDTLVRAIDQVFDLLPPEQRRHTPVSKIGGTNLKIRLGIQWNVTQWWDTISH